MILEVGSLDGYRQSGTNHQTDLVSAHILRFGEPGSQVFSIGIRGRKSNHICLNQSSVKPCPYGRRLCVCKVEVPWRCLKHKLLHNPCQLGWLGMQRAMIHSVWLSFKSACAQSWTCRRFEKPGHSDAPLQWGCVGMVGITFQVWTDSGHWCAKTQPPVSPNTESTTTDSGSHAKMAYSELWVENVVVL